MIRICEIQIYLVVYTWNQTIDEYLLGFPKIHRFFDGFLVMQKTHKNKCDIKITCELGDNVDRTKEKGISQILTKIAVELCNKIYSSNLVSSIAYMNLAKAWFANSNESNSNLCDLPSKNFNSTKKSPDLDTTFPPNDFKLDTFTVSIEFSDN